MSGPDEFGQLFKQKRISLGLTLREFCRKNDLDSGNISKLERGLLSPPTSHEKLEQYANMLGITEGSNDWDEFFDLASGCAGRIPNDILSDEELVKKLPAVFRTLRGNKLNDERLRELAEIIRRA